MSTKASARYGRGHELLAADPEEEVEHALVEHFPRADLLLDHVEARVLEVHLRESFCSSRGKALTELEIIP